MPRRPGMAESGRADSCLVFPALAISVRDCMRPEGSALGVHSPEGFSTAC